MHPMTIPPPPPQGPTYCDTAHMLFGIHEPVNTATNIFIFIAAYLAYRYVKKSPAGISGDLGLLLFLLTMTAVGSTLWHGLRTHWALQLDWMPGVAFLLVLTVLWIRQFFARPWLGWTAGILGSVAMMAASVVSVILTFRYFPHIWDLSPNLRFASSFAVIALFAIGLIAATWRKFGAAAGGEGALILVCALSAAVFRSIDLLICDTIPFGTHFLWHLLLSTASCLGILLLVKMKQARIANSE